MCKNLWLRVSTLLLWLLMCHHSHLASAQSQNAIGAHRLYQKTSFSCSGRGSGYYADVETGCQVYHMCDGLGRQFSYSCPNTTLFQQRMLICDHWYMVNCSKAESHYTANLLIGQRDKPFVNDEENSLRTPRPDLLDRPYAPDYSGESFRNQYQKSFPPALNQIFDGNAQKSKDKIALQTLNENNQPVGQQRWKIPPPSRVILPPAYEPQIQNDTTPSTPRTTSRVTYYSTTTTAKPSTLRPTTTHRGGTQGFKLNNVAALHIRPDEHLQYEHDDLGTSHSTRYNSSADFNSAEDKNTKNGQRKITTTTNPNLSLTSARPLTRTTIKTTPPTYVKVPSKIYEPPLLYPIYNLDDSNSTTSTTTTSTTTTTTTTTARPFYRASTASPFVTRQSTSRSTTTTRAPSRATTVLGKPFTRSPSYSTTTQSGRNINDFNRFDANKLSKEIRTPAPAQGFRSPTPRPSTASANNITQSSQDLVPSKHLQPPFTDFIQHDVATTQGPPIYYEWKVPSDGLEPPKLEVPIGVDGREYQDAAIDYSSTGTDGSFTGSVTNFGIDQKKNDNRQSARTPTSRSIKETNQPNAVPETRTKTSTASKAATQATGGPAAAMEDIFSLRKELSVPEYAFPLENAGRTGYLATDVYNSFQLKIPERRTDANEPLHWFGENPKCPECHPSYVKPGTCEPCLRR